MPVSLPTAQSEQASNTTSPSDHRISFLPSLSEPTLPCLSRTQHHLPINPHEPPRPLIIPDLMRPEHIFLQPGLGFHALRLLGRRSGGRAGFLLRWGWSALVVVLVGGRSSGALRLLVRSGGGGLPARARAGGGALASSSGGSLGCRWSGCLASSSASTSLNRQKREEKEENSRQQLPQRR